jgi:hypothetical protein
MIRRLLFVLLLIGVAGACDVQAHGGGKQAECEWSCDSTTTTGQRQTTTTTTTTTTLPQVCDVGQCADPCTPGVTRDDVYAVVWAALESFSFPACPPACPPDAEATCFATGGVRYKPGPKPKCKRPKGQDCCNKDAIRQCLEADDVLACQVLIWDADYITGNECDHILDR